MKQNILVVAVLVMSTSCSVRDVVEMPTIPQPPLDWHPYSNTTTAESGCPDLNGVYSERPQVHRSGKPKRFIQSDEMDLFSSYIPFHLGDQIVTQPDEFDLMADSFEIKQPDLTQFFIVYRNRAADEIEKLHFRQIDGDFTCSDGIIMFPEYQVNGMTDGSSLNFQVRNILVQDVTGALLIQSTRGPYIGNSSNSQEKFTYEFIRYTKAHYE